MDKRYYTTEEIAERLQLDAETVRRWIRDGEMSAVKVARQWRVSATDLERFLAERRFVVGG